MDSSPPPPITSQQPIQDLLLVQVLLDLDVLILEWKGDRLLEIIGDAPAWVAQSLEFSCLPGEYFSAESFSPFLDNFLLDAKAFWQESRMQSLRSGDLPEWVEQAFEFDCPREEAFATETFSPFLENFLLNTKALWSEKHVRSLSSGIWSETRFSGSEIHLEAIALSLEGQQIILVESSELMGSEKFQWLQIAREEQLKFIAERKGWANKQIASTEIDTLNTLKVKIESRFFMFEPGLTELRTSYMAHLYDQAHDIKALSQAASLIGKVAYITIRGFGDRGGGASHNLWLAQGRADSLKRALVKYDIGAACLDVKGPNRPQEERYLDHQSQETQATFYVEWKEGGRR